jgi:hypothetical protein
LPLILFIISQWVYLMIIQGPVRFHCKRDSYRTSYRRKSLTDISAKFQYEIRYELPSDLTSEWFFATITVHIGLISEMHTPKLDSKSQKQRKKPVGPNDFYMKRLSDQFRYEVRYEFISDLISESLFPCISDMNTYLRSIGFISEILYCIHY